MCPRRGGFILALVILGATGTHCVFWEAMDNIVRKVEDDIAKRSSHGF